MSSFAPRRTTHSQRDMIHGALCMRSTSQQFASAILLETSVCVRNCARPALTEVGVSLRVVLKPAVKDGAHLSNWYSVLCSWNWEGGAARKNRLMCFFVTSPLSICCNRLRVFIDSSNFLGCSSQHSLEKSRTRAKHGSEARTINTSKEIYIRLNIRLVCGHIIYAILVVPTPTMFYYVLQEDLGLSIYASVSVSRNLNFGRRETWVY